MEFVRQVALEQRRRLVASVMEHFEKTVLPRVPGPERETLHRATRDKVMQAVGQYHDFVLDCLRASIASEVVVNEEAIALLQQIHQGQIALTRQLEQVD